MFDKQKILGKLGKQDNNSMRLEHEDDCVSVCQVWKNSIFTIITLILNMLKNKCYTWEPSIFV